MHIKAAFLKTLASQISDTPFFNHLYTGDYVDLFSQKYRTCNHLEIKLNQPTLRSQINHSCTFLDLREILREICVVSLSFFSVKI